LNFEITDILMVNVPAETLQQLKKTGQEHVLAWWDQLSETERRELIDQLRGIRFEHLGQLYSQRDWAVSLPSADEIEPVPVIQVSADSREALQAGEDSFKRGEVAVLVVAGGQGSRLGFDHAKGMFPISPVRNKSLFQIHAEKVLALSQRYRKPVPFLVMTSPATHAETESFFLQHSCFGIPQEDVALFCQGSLPALDMATGKLILEKPGQIFTSPNGHGGVLTALAESGLLGRLRRQKIQNIFYFQVDNPLVNVADPVFLGHHLSAKAEVSSKVVRKDGPSDKLGNVVLIDGSCCIIEYSDLPECLGQQTDENGQLRIWAGSPAIHFFHLDFLAQVTQSPGRIPFHIARKKVPYLDEKGQRKEPQRENALKFELFIFDVLPMAQRWTVVETTRSEEFVPLKNASGPDSPEVVRKAMSNQAARWLEKAGIRVPRDPKGESVYPLEISPLFALNAGELAAKVDRDMEIQGPTYIGYP
jgi:UDP-N-acetylglucosamine/UDP-N-acetylgalactosamine diphosphorylase